MLRISEWIKKHQLLSFFALSYLITFGFQFGLIWLRPGEEMRPWSIIWFFSVFSPTFAALIISWVIGGKAEVKHLLSGLTRWKVGFFWYIAALFLFLGPLVIALVYSFVTGSNLSAILAAVSLPALLAQVFFQFFSGPASEEVGWRGFALPRLEAKYNALVSSLILGVIHTFWHLPLFYMTGMSQMGIPMPIYLVLVISVNTYLTWLYNNTAGSLVIAILAHYAFDLTGIITEYLKIMPPMVFNITSGPMLGLVVIAVVIIFGPKLLSKKPLEEMPFRKS